MKRGYRWAAALAVAWGTGVSAGAWESGLSPDQETALRAIARDQKADWPTPTAEQWQALHEKAAAQWVELETHHLAFNQVVDVFWTDKTRTAINRYDTVGDSTCWTGHYLAALAFRFKAAGEPEVLDAIRETLDVYDLLTRISGREGYIVRFAGKADDPAYREYYHVYGRGEDPERPGLGKWAYRGAEPHSDWVWLGNSSRDTYIGFNFGISAVWANVDDPVCREKITGMVTRVGTRLIGDDWRIVDGKGHETRPTPYFKVSWMRTMATAAPDAFPDMESAYDEALAAIPERSRRTYPMTFKEYYANNLAFATAYSLWAMENRDGHRSRLGDGIAEMYDEVMAHLNAQFAMLCLATAGERNAHTRAVAVGQLMDIPGPPRWFAAVDNREMADNPVLDEKHLTYALLAHEQIPTDFLWQRSPSLSHGGVDASYEPPGLDLVLPYWIGRAAGVIPAPE